MGLSASQARLLSLTARLSDLELRAQQVSNSKIRLAMQGTEASGEYEKALDKEELFIKSGVNADGTVAEQELNYLNLTGPDSPLTTQYGLCDQSGKILVTKREGDAFVAANGSVEEFCRLMGAPYKVTYANGATQAQYDDSYKKFLEAEKNLNDYANNTVNGTSNGPKRVNGYISDGQWAYAQTTNVTTALSYTDSQVFSQLSATGKNYANSWGGGTVAYANSPDTNNVLCFSKGDDLGAVSSALTNLVTNITADTSNSIKSILQSGNGSADYLAKVDSAIAAAKSQTQSFYQGQLQRPVTINENQVVKTSGGFIIFTPYDKDNTITVASAQGTNQIWDDQYGSQEYYIDLSQVTKTFLSNFDAAFAAQNGASGANYASQVTDTGTNRPASGQTYISVISPLIQNYNSTDNPDKIDYQDPNGEGLGNVQLKYEAYLKAYQDALAALKAFGDKKVTKSERTDYYANLYNKMVDGYFTEKDETSTINNPQWTQNQILNGGLVLYKCTKDSDSDKMTWKGQSWQTCTDIDEEHDKDYIAKAEVKYESEMNQINEKDKKFDRELKNIDTEHQAIQTEIDSVQKVIGKNIDRTLKPFQA